MATTGDPWRTLGLAPGASLDEVRRAYRRLAKANHPDAAGEGALPRFLAIQAAYEAIAGPAFGRRVGGRPGAGSRSATPSPSEPWRADPDRARASGRADGRRPRPGSRPGEGPATGPAANARSRADAGPGGPGGSAGGGSDRTHAGPAGRGRRSSSRRPKTAGPYSTSYDAADEEPFEPGWSGATWYGASSGTYWTINPKEYADPRKHGPEYQARARRARKGSGWIRDDAAEPDGEAPGPDPAESEAAPTQDRARPAEERPSTPGAGDPRPREPRPARQRPPGPRPSTWTGAASAAAGAHDAAAPGRAPGDAPPRPPTAAEMHAATGGSGVHAPVLPAPRTAGGRAAIALLGWPPLALFAASAIGESTGCGRYAASCAEASSPGTWVLGLAIFILLLAAPAVARWSAHGTVAMLLIGGPVAVILSAAGGTNVREASAPILLGVLAVAYLIGIAYGLLGPRLGPTHEPGRVGSIR